MMNAGTTRNCPVRLRLALTLAVVLLASLPGSVRSEIVDLSGVFTLENGLEVRSMHDASTPVVAVLALVGTGYASEGADRSGFSHLLEHLVFAGTGKRSREEIQREVEGLGGYVNGFTRDDYTGYLIVGHRDHLERLLDVLSDMLFHSTIPEEGVGEARQVVLEEIRRSQSRPGTREEELFQALLYEGSPYARTGLGNETTVTAATREEIEAFYRRVYRPDNMVLLIRGGFDPEGVAVTVKNVFGAEAMGGPQPPVTRPDPPLAHRTYILSSDMPEVRVRVGFGGPDPRDGQAEALELLAGILGGPDGALDRALKGAGMQPRSTSAALVVNRGFSRFLLSATLPAGSDPSAVEQILLEAVQATLEGEDLSRRLQQTRETLVAGEVMGREKLHYFLMGKASWVVAGSPGQGFSPGRWDDLTEKDLTGAASRYILGKPYVALLTVPASRRDVTGEGAGGPVKAEAMLDNGLHVVAEERPGSSVFALHLMTRHRSALEPEGKEGIADFLHRLLPRGTDERTGEEVDAALRELGVSLSTAGNPTVPFGDFYTSRLYSYIRLECLQDKASEAVSLLSEMVRAPRLDPEQVEQVRQQMLDFVAYLASTPGKVASAKLAGQLYGDVLAEDVYGSTESLAAITREDLAAFHREYFTGRNLVVSVVSGLPPEEAIAMVEQALAAIPAGEPAAVPPLTLTTAPAVLEVAMGKPQGALAAGAVTGRSPAREEPALTVASALLNTRLVEELREKQGLAYSLGASLGSVGDAAVFTFSMGTAPDKIQRAREELRAQIAAAREAEVLPGDMEREINGLVGRLQMRMLSSINRAYYLGLAAREGLPHTFGEDYRQRLLALTPADIEAVNRAYLPVDTLVEVVVR